MSEIIKEKLKEIQKIANEVLTREEFLTSFKKIIAHLTQTEVKLNKRIDSKIQDGKEKLAQLTKEFETVIAKADKERNNTFGGIRQKTKEAISKLFASNDVNKKLSEQLDRAQSVMDSVKDGEPGQPGEPGKDGESIKGEPGKDVDSGKIKALEAEIETLKSMIRRKGVGGTSAMGVAQAMKRILKTEEPVGLINGSNKVYSLNHTIFAIFSMSLNGEVVAQLPNYTISGKTFTFTTALPSAYSGKDWEVKYI